MNTYDKVTIEILKYVDKMNNDEEFKKGKSRNNSTRISLC